MQLVWRSHTWTTSVKIFPLVWEEKHIWLVLRCNFKCLAASNWILMHRRFHSNYSSHVGLLTRITVAETLLELKANFIISWSSHFFLTQLMFIIFGCQKSWNWNVQNPVSSILTWASYFLLRDDIWLQILHIRYSVYSKHVFHVCFFSISRAQTASLIFLLAHSCLDRT